MTGGARFCTLIVMKDNNREYPPKYNIRKRSTAMARATTLRSRLEINFTNRVSML
jgi:hypothetical protein